MEVSDKIQEAIDKLEETKWAVSAQKRRKIERVILELEEIKEMPNHDY